MLKSSGAQLGAPRRGYLELALELAAVLPHLCEVLAAHAAAVPTTARRFWCPSAFAGTGVGAAVAAVVYGGLGRQRFGTDPSWHPQRNTRSTGCPHSTHEACRRAPRSRS